MNDNTQDPAEEALSEEAASALEKLGLSVSIWDRDITPEEIQYLIDRAMFLQVVSANDIESKAVEVLRSEKTNWVILNYGDALTSSPGEFLFGGGDFTIPSTKQKTKDENEDEEGGGTLVNPGKGTVWAQGFRTAADMMALAEQLGWDGVHVVDGHPFMQWAAWMYATDHGLGLTGFEPTEKDMERRERVKRSEIEDAKRFVFKA